jgi:hypothetical protein
MSSIPGKPDEDFPFPFSPWTCAEEVQPRLSHGSKEACRVRLPPSTRPAVLGIRSPAATFATGKADSTYMRPYLHRPMAAPSLCATVNDEKL